ncbi:DUF6493 family protein [Streptomyces sp. NPDC056600]|uniref:DUF6493 family protein n=1 Tax=Streptomyces sp. NPDC056600 TaxID=3345874 RepID=UPI00367C096F
MTTGGEPVAAIRAGDTVRTLDLLEGLSAAERRSVVPELRGLRAELRRDPWAGASRTAYPPLLAAGVACMRGAAAVASWLTGPDLRFGAGSTVTAPTVLRLVEDRGADWLADLAGRLAARPSSAAVSFELMSGLVRLADSPPPVTEGYVTGWVRHRTRAVRAEDGTLLERLRGDGDLRSMVGALFEIEDMGLLLDGSGAWSGALLALTGEGLLPREVMIDGCLSRLLRGGRAGDLRFFQHLLIGLELTARERRERVADWRALAADGPSTVAAHARTVLGELALDGTLPAGALAEISAAVLFRPEKKLVRAQLTLIGRYLSGRPGAAGELLACLGPVLGHQDAALRDRALALIARHLPPPPGGGEVREALAADAASLPAAPRERLLRVLGLGAGADAVVEPYVEALPPVRAPRRLAPPPATAAEVAEETGVLLASGGRAAGDVAAFERTLDGLVRWAHRDREALLGALEPVVATRWWSGGGRSPRDGMWGHSRFTHHFPGAFGIEHGVDLLLASLHFAVKLSALHSAVMNAGPEYTCVHGHLARAFQIRLWEAAHRLRTDPQPFLLSTPTWDDGSLEPAELVGGLEEYRRLEARVGENDFAQALLRLRLTDPAARAAAAGRARALGTPEGERLAQWLDAGGPGLPQGRTVPAGDLIGVEYAEAPALRRLPRGFRGLGMPVGAQGCDRTYCPARGTGLEAYWPALLPGHRELVAARTLRTLSASVYRDGPADTGLLPRLAESGGGPGPALRLSVAYGMFARSAEDRLPAVDALLLLAARGDLDAEATGADLAALVLSGTVVPSRLAEALRTAADGGAGRTTWSVLRYVLPPLLEAAEPVNTRALGDLLAVAADCAERIGAPDAAPVRGVDAVAERGGSSRLVGQARRLRAATATSTDPSAVDGSRSAEAFV